jgi:poly(3-hydroxyalkanoate) synthetase
MINHLYLTQMKNGQIHSLGNVKKNITSPVIVIYAFINRHYILDLLPGIGVVRNLLFQGLNIYAPDWGTPSVYDRTLTVGHFVNRYIDSSIDIIRRITKSIRVSAWLLLKRRSYTYVLCLTS